MTREEIRNELEKIKRNASERTSHSTPAVNTRTGLDEEAEKVKRGLDEMEHPEHRTRNYGYL